MNDSLILIGAWVEVVGLILAAISETQDYLETSNRFLLLVSVGEAIQSVGQGLGAKTAIASLANYIESAGGATSSYAIREQFKGDSDDAIKLEILGDILQAGGAALAAEVGEDPVLNLGNKLESIAATLEAIGGVHSLREEDSGKGLLVIGSWIQALGGLTYSIRFTKKISQ